jgi:hypothetical protein
MAVRPDRATEVPKASFAAPALGESGSAETVPGDRVSAYAAPWLGFTALAPGAPTTARGPDTATEDPKRSTLSPSAGDHFWPVPQSPLVERLKI